MTLMREKGSGRLHIKSELMGESLVSNSFLRSLDFRGQFKALPDLNVLKIGGQSIADRGAKALLPILEEVVANAATKQMVITTGGGTRSRHVYAIAADLGMPPGVLAKLGSSISEQNALMLTMLLMPYGGIKVGHDDIVKLPAYLRQGCIPVMQAMPPYHYFEMPPRTGVIPENRTDVGTYLLAEVIGAKRCIYVKDENGLYTDNPKKKRNVRFIRKIGAKQLLAMDLDDLIIERPVLEYMLRAKHAKEIQIINGLQYGNLTRALNGEHVGTIIYKDV